VLAVLVAVKIAQLLLIATNVASCLLGAFFNPVCDATTVAEPEMEELVETVQKTVHTVLTGLYATESAVAMGMPYVAEVKSILVARSYGPTVHGGLMV